MNKILAIDIDNTVSDTIETWMNFTEIILKEQGVIAKRKPGVFSTTDAFGIERGSELYKIVKLRNQELNKTNWKDYKQIKGARENLIKLKELGFNIIFVSARSDEYFGDAYKISKNWLDYVGIPYDEIICNCEDKGLMCRNKNVDILIDDGLQYCQKAIENGCKAIYFDDENQSTKQSGENKSKDIITCRNWDEIFTSIIMLTKENKKYEEIDLRY